MLIGDEEYLHRESVSVCRDVRWEVGRLRALFLYASFVCMVMGMCCMECG